MDIIIHYHNNIIIYLLPGRDCQVVIKIDKKLIVMFLRNKFKS
jgi:hypothetical protein